MNADLDPQAHLAARNPFASRATRPGALSYELANGDKLDTLVERLAGNGWWGEIVGNHGTGKSTLVCSLLEPLRVAGRSPRHFTLHRGEKRFPVSGLDLKSWDGATQIIVDGYEQLGGWSRTILKRICRRQGCGLLVTAHTSAGFPALFETAVTLELAERLVTRLAPNGSQFVAAVDVARSYERHRGNLREVFFDLYDLYESRRPR